MGIETNSAATAGDDSLRDETRTGNFAGADIGARAAVTGALDFVSLSTRFGIQRADANVEPYLETIKKLTNESLGNNVTVVRAEMLTSGYAVKYVSLDGVINLFFLLFISTGDPIRSDYMPPSMKLNILRKEFSDRYSGKDIRVVDARLVIADYEPDMNRAEKMADTIVRTFNATTVAELRDAKITSLVTNEFAADWRLSEARSMEDALSPHGIRPRLEVALTLKAKVQNNMGLGREYRDFAEDYRPFGVIGGYVEIRDKEPVQVGNERLMLYRPVFVITTISTVIPLEGSAVTLLAALAPTIYNSLFWASQWKSLNEGDANPGMLEMDPANPGRPYILKDQEQLKEFVETYFARPEIAFQFVDGRDNIPGMWKLASNDSSDKAKFINRLTNFFDVPEENGGSFPISRTIEVRYDGAYGDAKGMLHDSRDIDYLYIAAKNGAGSIDRDARRVLLGNGESPTERARIVTNVTNSFIPLSVNTTAMVNPDFIKWVAEKAQARRLVVIDPNQQMESRSLGSFTDGFGSSAGIGSIITHGVASRGVNLGSIWATNFG